MRCHLTPEDSDESEDDYVYYSHNSHSAESTPTVKVTLDTDTERKVTPILSGVLDFGDDDFTYVDPKQLLDNSLLRNKFTKSSSNLLDQHQRVKEENAKSLDTTHQFSIPHSKSASCLSDLVVKEDEYFYIKPGEVSWAARSLTRSRSNSCHDDCSDSDDYDYI